MPAADPLPAARFEDEPSLTTLNRSKDPQRALFVGARRTEGGSESSRVPREGRGACWKEPEPWVLKALEDVSEEESAWIGALEEAWSGEERSKGPRG